MFAIVNVKKSQNSKQDKGQGIEHKHPSDLSVSSTAK